jgi:hypothetical protein
MLIDGMYHSLVRGKMDQRRELFMVDECLGRDVSSSDLSAIVSALSVWCAR